MSSVAGCDSLLSQKAEEGLAGSLRVSPNLDSQAIDFACELLGYNRAWVWHDS
jgi:hypothetical protein